MSVTPERAQSADFTDSYIAVEVFASEPELWAAGPQPVRNVTPATVSVERLESFKKVRRERSVMSVPSGLV